MQIVPQPRGLDSERLSQTIYQLRAGERVPRRTGRTTAIMFLILGEALFGQGRVVGVVVDSYHAKKAFTNDLYNFLWVDFPVGVGSGHVFCDIGTSTITAHLTTIRIFSVEDLSSGKLNGWNFDVIFCDVGGLTTSLKYISSMLEAKRAQGAAIIGLQT